jgi:type IV fimbrial biogenesis protein FimT
MRSARHAPAGFTLIELMITISVLAVISAMAMPSFIQMLRNYQVRVAAESVANGMQRARAEAVARNASMQFVLNGADTSWTVDYVNKPVSTDPPVDSRSNQEGSQNASLTATPTSATTITFNNLGQIIANPDSTPTLTQIDFTATQGNQNLRVTVGAGGNARVCDPSLPSTNVRAC